MTERTTRTFRNLNVLHSFDGPSATNYPAFDYDPSSAGTAGRGQSLRGSAPGCRRVRLEDQRRMRSNERHALSAARPGPSIGGRYKTPTGSEASVQAGAAGVVALLACGAVASAAYRTLRRTELASAAAAAADGGRRRG